tara:strand:- start:808 stop:1068 length:261 start_codon:yes stop_codon:yes gene_type:complete
MEGISDHLVDIGMTALGSAIFALIGFVWKISHRMSELEKSTESQREVARRDLEEVKKDIDVIYSNVDKNREWTTNRMMSIAKEMKG